MRLEGRQKGKNSSPVLKAACCALPAALLVADRVKHLKPGACPLSFLKMLFPVSSAIAHLSMLLGVIS